MAASEHAQVLQNDRFKQRRHQFISRGAHLLQTVDIGLSEDPAFSGDFVQLDTVILLLAKFQRWNLQFGIDLVDDRTSAARALIVHGWNFLLAAGFLVVLEHNDLGILTAELNHRIDLGMHLLHGE